MAGEKDSELLEKSSEALSYLQKKKAKKQEKRNGANNVCRFGIWQGIISFFALITFVVAWFCIHKVDPLPGWYKIIVLILLQVWVRAEKYISLVVWLICRHLKKKYEAKGEPLKSAGAAVSINRAYLFAAAIPTLLVQLFLLIKHFI